MPSGGPIARETSGRSNGRNCRDVPKEFLNGDSQALKEWKQRLASDDAQLIYRERSATAETVNADLRTWRSPKRFLVRGKQKAMCVVLWNALTYNILR